MTLTRAVGAVPLGHLGVRERDHPGELRRQVREGVLRQADRHRAVRAGLLHPEQQPHAEAQPALLAGRASPTSTASRSTTSATTTSACCRSRAVEAHIIDSVPPANVASLKKAAGVNVELYPAWEVDLLVFNEKLPQFADRHVRRAITYAINRPALVAATSFGTAKPGGSFLPPSLAVLRRRHAGARLQPLGGQGRARAVQVPARLQDQAADLRRRPEVGRVRADHPAVARRR